MAAISFAVPESWRAASGPAQVEKPLAAHGGFQEIEILRRLTEIGAFAARPLLASVPKGRTTRSGWKEDISGNLFFAEQTNPEKVEQLLATQGLADALESDRFKQFLDHVPVAIAVAELQPSEAITYYNFQFERLIGQSAADIEGHDWKVLPGIAF